MDYQQTINCSGRRGATLLRAVRVLVMLILISNVPATAPAFARNPGLDCLVQVEVADTGSLPFEEFRRLWIDFLINRRLNGIDKPAGVTHAWESRRRMYVLVSNDCAQKVEYVRSFITEFLTESGIPDSVMKAGDAVNPSDRVKRAFTLPPPPKYARRDCIVEIGFVAGSGPGRWSSLDNSNPTRFMMNYVLKRHPRISLFSSSGQGDRLYILFYDQCDRRIEMAKELTTFYMGRYPAGPKFIVHEKTVDPAPNTIDDNGPGWTDTRPLTHPRNVP